MVVSRQNLQVVDITKPDKQIQILDCVNILSDGSTVGGNGKAFIAVSPVPMEIREKVAKVYGDDKSESVNVSSETVKEVLKNIPSDRKFAGMLEHANVIASDSNSVQFTLYDGARKRNLSGKVNPASYPPYKKLFKRALTNKQQIKVKINAKRFISLFETIIKCSGDTSDISPVYIEFTVEGDIILRMENSRTKQRCVGIMWAMKGHEDTWLEYSSFERSLMCEKKAKRRGNSQLSRIIDEQCPECGKYHLATDGVYKWCSGLKGCSYFRKG